ncbi:MAG: dTMP kinase [Candidatus Caldarchaeum sp.]|jgi:dTMP kinase
MLGSSFVVAWEGVDGSGKTTLMNAVVSKLAERGHGVQTYKTPSLTPSGIFAAQHGNRPETDPLTRMLLFLANTSDDSSVIKKIIEEKKPDYMMIDRYSLCSVVYGFALWSKRYGRKVEEKLFTQFIEIVEMLGKDVFAKPDLTVVVEVDEETRRRRTAQKTVSSDRVLEVDEELQRLVSQYYDVYLMWRPSEAVKVFNGDSMLDEVASMLAEKLVFLREARLRG